MYSVRLLTEGRLRGIAGVVSLEAGPTDTVIFDLSRPFEVEWAPASPAELTRECCLWLPRAAWLAAAPDDRVSHGLVLRGADAAGAVLSASLRALFNHASRLTAAEMDRLAGSIGDLCARAAADAMQGSGATAEAPLDSFVTVRRYIERNLRSPKLGPDSIAKDFGLSRASLYRLFAPAGGPANYIRSRRLRQAYEQIVAAGGANMRIGAIAYEAGFTNLSAFGRAFKQAYGCSPAQARKDARPHPSAPLFETTGDGALLAELRTLRK